jgi:hypothetical protein
MPDNSDKGITAPRGICPKCLLPAQVLYETRVKSITYWWCVYCANQHERNAGETGRTT